MAVKKEKKVEAQAVTETVVESPPAPVVSSETTETTSEVVVPGPELKPTQKAAPAEIPTPMPTITEVVSLLAKGSESFAKGTENLLRAVERLNTVTNRLEAKVVVPDGFATREELNAATEVVTAAMSAEVSGAIGTAVGSLKDELTVAFNALARAVCEACGREWGDEPSSHFFPGPAIAPASANGDQAETSDLEKAMEELTI